MLTFASSKSVPSPASDTSLLNTEDGLGRKRGSMSPSSVIRNQIKKKRAKTIAETPKNCHALIRPRRRNGSRRRRRLVTKALSTCDSAAVPATAVATPFDSIFPRSCSLIRLLFVWTRGVGKTRCLLLERRVDELRINQIVHIHLTREQVGIDHDRLDLVDEIRERTIELLLILLQVKE